MAEKMGILGRKLGMTRIFDGAGAAVPVTVIEAGPCPVTQVKTAETDGYNAVQIALTPAKEKHSTPEQELGQELTVEIFAACDMVKVTGTSMGKGYQGRMRRWNFAGSKDTHGCEKVHRNNGSIGNNTFPGHVFKGRKMAGHWGNETVTEMGLTIVDVRPEDNVILVKGSVPGPKNGLVLIRKP